ncbi:unnamed protein product [Miscanthus lutarioriparius]|uniref:Pentatricopeptide repeat-containing protein n=1 Tax=Miscanthus lutarioriparius TaxID=422564 RepID=A0A811RR60_9POAL|nr:unnamed protein product [Miscanthus lutarioriparius]
MPPRLKGKAQCRWSIRFRDKERGGRSNFELPSFLCICMLPPAAAAAIRATAGSPRAVRRVHARLLKEGLADLPSAPALLVSAYARSCLFPDARRVFDDAPRRDLHLYSALLAAVSRSPTPALALPLLRRMLSEDALRPDHFVLASLAIAASRLRSLRLGRQLHAHFVASPYSADDIVKSSLVDMYCNCGVPQDARKVFESIGVKNSVVWTALVSGYASNGCTGEAIDLFRSMPARGLFTWTALISGFVKAGNNTGAVGLFVEMRRDGVRIDDAFVLATVVGGAADLAALVLGRQLHGFAIRLGFLSSMIVGNALVDMYSKCSDIHSAREVFEGITVRDVISWTTILVGEAQHGRAEEVLALYDRMLLAGMKPNESCWSYLERAAAIDSMKREYGIKPGLQHYTCYLDLVSRPGYLSEAEELITTMPYEPDEAINCKWDSVAKVRKIMAEMEIRKEPGYSWIEAGKESRIFHAGEVPLDVGEEITGFLEELVSEMRKRGYVPDTSSVMHDLEEHEKEQHLFLRGWL